MSEQTKNKWIVNGLLAVILALLGGYYIRSGVASAFAAGGGWETDGVMAISTVGDNDRLVLVDTTKQNIMVYKILNKQFRLVGARSYKYDVEIEDTAGTKIEQSGTGATYLEVWQFYQSRPAPK
ncbi:MAG TPA: hypothetical protein VEJ63_21225 [Planctomycetota bacterium]|nr:hypothetical protein [Planctomycetota bacterium]